MSPARGAGPAWVERAYGDHRPWLWWHGIRDRLRGEPARANARWGRVRPPAGRGRVVWIKTGADRDSVRLGAELLGAIRQRRLDVRLVLTFETDYPDIIGPRLRGLRGTGIGFGPCDAPPAVERVLRRLEPFALILVGGSPRPRLMEAAEARVPHRAAFSIDPPATGNVEIAYPVSPAQAQAWAESGRAGEVGPVVDPLALLAEAQLEPKLRGLVSGGGPERRIWWAHGVDGGAAELATRWRASVLADDGVLFLSSGTDDAAPALKRELTRARVESIPISDWDRGPLDPGSVVRVDARRWLPGIAGGCHASYLAEAERSVVWQAWAAGAPASLAPAVAGRYAHLVEALGAEPAPTVGDVDAVLRTWSEVREAPHAGRRLGDAQRRLFWQARREATSVMEGFLQRVFDW